MEEKKELPVRVSKEFNFDLDIIYIYGVETFGIKQAELYENEIWKLIEGLSHNWPLFSECRHLPTKSKKYRLDYPGIAPYNLPYNSQRNFKYCVLSILIGVSLK